MREKQKWEETEINTLEMQTPAVCHFQLVNRLRGGPHHDSLDHFNIYLWPTQSRLINSVPP